jgi:iron complex outermembrane receptor protein
MRKTFFLLTALSASLFAAEEFGQRGATWAQKLVDETLAKHKDVIIMALHVADKDGSDDHKIIASNIGRIGKPADEDDMRVIRTGKPNLEVNTAGNHFEVELALRDVKGKILGACGIVFNYKNGDDKQALRKKAEAIGKEMQARIDSRAKLFEPLK